MQQEIYTEKILEIQAFAESETQWLIENIGADGELYMNYTDNGAKDVNPYFSCLGMQGLLVGEVTEDDLELVKEYLIWHRQKFLEEDGVISNYVWDGNELVASGEYDSIDSYIGVYLSLLCQYGILGGELSEVDPEGIAFKLGVEQLELLTADGLTAVDNDTSVYYLMDNIEVQSAYEDVIICLQQCGEEWIGVAETAVLIEKVTVLLEENQQSVEELWNEELGVYEIGISSNGELILFDTWEEWYPSAISQIYSIGFLNEIETIERMEILYSEFCLSQEWETRELIDVFPWAVVAYISAKMGDVERVEIYLANYKEQVSVERAYPLYTGEIGWVLKACVELEEEYNIMLERNMFEVICDWMKEQIVWN